VIAGKRARTTERQHTGCRSGLPWLGRGVGLPAGIGCRRVPGLPPEWLVLAALHRRQFAGPSFSRPLKAAAGRQRRQCRAVPGGDRRQVMPWRRRGSAPAADRGCRGWAGCRVAGKPRLPWAGQCWRDSITGSASGPLSSRSVKPATRRQRRQHRAVPGGDRRQTGQVEGEAAHWQPIGVAVAWSGCRVAGKPRLPRLVSAGGTRTPAVRRGLRPRGR
jgi:hypothetical protein